MNKNSIVLVQTQSAGEIPTGTELESLMDTYNYAPAGQGLWAVQDTGEVAIKTNDDFTRVEIIGDPQNVMRDINWILMRGGWAACRVVCDDADLFDLILRYLTNLSVTEDEENSTATAPTAQAIGADNETDKRVNSAGFAGSTQHPPKSQPATAMQTSSDHAKAPLSEDHSATHVVQHELNEALAELHVKTEALAAAEERIATLEDELQSAKRNVKGMHHEAADSAKANLATQLLKAIENHLASSIDTNTLLAGPLARELENLGIKVRVSVSLCQ